MTDWHVNLAWMLKEIEKERAAAGDPFHPQRRSKGEKARNKGKRK